MRGWMAGTLVLLGVAGCGPSLPVPVNGGPGPAPRGLLDVLASPGAPPSAGLAVATAAGEAAWAAGWSQRGRPEPAHPDQPVRIASITKTFVAAALLRLSETGQLDLDAPVARHLSDRTRAALARDGYDPAAITTAMLLAHTSGLADHWGLRLYQAQVRWLPWRRWTRDQQIAFALSVTEPVGLPGERFFYSDTGYLIAGEILERASGQPMAGAVRQLVGFERLGLGSTWWEVLETAPAGAAPRAHQYIGWQDGTNIDASMDLFGAGGLVAIDRDLARFFLALGTGQVFERPETLARMLAPTAQSLAAANSYGLGIGRSDKAGATCYGHGGFWGASAWVCPQEGWAGAVHVTSTDARPLLGALEAAAVDVARAKRTGSAP